MTPFWIVVSDSRGPACWPCRHTSQDSAIAESVRLTRTNGGKFYVMEAQLVTEKRDVVTRRLADDMEIPF